MSLCHLQEFHLSAIEQRIMQEIELRIMMITYREIVTEDGELIVTAAPTEATQPAFDTPVKNYRIMEGMGVTFHCKVAGMPLPKVPRCLISLAFCKTEIESSNKTFKTVV